MADPDTVKLGKEVDFISMETKIKLLKPQSRPDRDPVIDETEYLTHPVCWRRDFLHVAVPDSDIPEYILLRDNIGETKESWSWSIWALAEEAIRDGDGWRMKGDYGIDLWVWIEENPEIEKDGFSYVSTQGAAGNFKGTPEMRNGFMNHRFRSNEFGAGKLKSQSGEFNGLEQRLSAVRRYSTGASCRAARRHSSA